MYSFSGSLWVPTPHLSLDSYFDSTISDAADFMAQRQSFMQNLRDNLLQAQNRMKFFANRKWEEWELQVGDMVFLKLQPFRQNSVSLRRNLKLSAHFYGPYTILERIGNVAYRLDLPESSRIHPVFHVSLLKKCVGKNIVLESAVPKIDDEGRFLIAPLSLLDNRHIHRRGVEVFQLLVQWEKSRINSATWEDFQVFVASFQLLILADKDRLKAGVLLWNNGLKKRRSFWGRKGI